MKNLFILVSLSFALFSGCQKGNVTTNLENNYLVEFIDNKVEFVKDIDQIIIDWENQLKEDVKDISFNSIEIIEFEGNYYLQGTGEKYTSTTLLGFTGNKGQPITVTCTTSSCSNTNGCMPQSDNTCSTCIWGDCTRSVTVGK